MTDVTKPEITPRIDEDGEAWCAGADCPAGYRRLGTKDTAQCPYVHKGYDCVPALRRQRDEARARAEKAEVELADEIESRDRRIAELEKEVERLRGDVTGWRVRSQEQFDRIGKALEGFRKHRRTGEPSRDDATEVEALVAELGRLRSGEERSVKFELLNAFNAALAEKDNKL